MRAGYRLALPWGTFAGDRFTVIEGLFSPYARVRMVRSKVWVAARVSLQLACVPRPAWARRLRCLRATLAAARQLFCALFLSVLHGENIPNCQSLSLEKGPLI